MAGRCRVGLGRPVLRGDGPAKKDRIARLYAVTGGRVAPEPASRAGEPVVVVRPDTLEPRDLRLHSGRAVGGRRRRSAARSEPALRCGPARCAAPHAFTPGGTDHTGPGTPAGARVRSCVITQADGSPSVCPPLPSLL